MSDFHILADIDTAMAKGKPHPILENIRFRIDKGDILGIIGDSGAGKSSLARILSGSAPPTWKINGEIKLSVPGLRILYLLQDPGSAFPPYLKVKKVWEQIRSNQSKDVNQKFFSLLSKLDLDPGLLDSFPGWLSGGEKQRLLFAMGIAVEPDVIILDEPTSSLDPRAKELVINIIEEYKTDITILVISHDLELLERLCKRIMFIHHGRIIESLNIQNKLHLSMLKHQHSRLFLEIYQKRKPVETETT